MGEKKNINHLSHDLLKFCDDMRKLDVPVDPEFLKGFEAGVRSLRDGFFKAKEAGELIYFDNKE